jgi:hypothetical protein
VPDLEAGKPACHRYQLIERAVPCLPATRKGVDSRKKSDFTAVLYTSSIYNQTSEAKVSHDAANASRVFQPGSYLDDIGSDG